jgi:arsenate reductase
MSTGEASGRERILVICTGNSARSQMAEGLLRALGGGRVEAFSAGSRPAERVHPLAVRAMAEVGIDIAHQRPKHLREFAGREIDWVIVVCALAAHDCPHFPGARATLQWFYDDPAAAEGSEEERLAAFRAVRDDLARRITAWLALPPAERLGEEATGLTGLTGLPGLPR